MSPIDVAFSFVAAINRRSADDIADLMTEDHLFIDSLGARFEGRTTMRQGWKAYLDWFPDYSIAIVEVFDRGQVVILTGTAQGTYAGSSDHWQTPAAWRALMTGDLVAEWRVWADNDPVRRILAKHHQ